MNVSLVVPVKNEADSIERLLNSVRAQTRQPDEVIIVDGGSSDGTPEIIETWSRQHSMETRLRVIRTDGATPGKGRNIGFHHARYEWVALTDAGIRLEANWLECLCEVAKRDQAVKIVYGNYEPVAETFFERCSALAYVAPKQRCGNRLIRSPFIASSMLRKELWEAVGGFPDLRAAEDLAFMRSIERLAAESAYKIGWAHNATVWWQLQPTLLRTFRRFTLYSQHNVWAGQQRYWHYGVARQYAVWLICLLFAIWHSAWWLILPVAGFVARVAKTIWVRSEGRGIFWLINPAQFAGVLGILLMIDLATFAGWCQALLKKQSQAA